MYSFSNRPKPVNSTVEIVRGICYFIWGYFALALTFWCGASFIPVVMWVVMLIAGTVSLLVSLITPML